MPWRRGCGMIEGGSGSAARRVGGHGIFLRPRSLTQRGVVCYSLLQPNARGAVAQLLRTAFPQFSCDGRCHHTLGILDTPIPPRPEVWLRGPLPDVAPVLQPVAHALVQAREEVDAIAAELPDARLWDRPAGVASAGFHLRHLAGVLDRLTTYARGDALSAAQLAALAGEETPDPRATAAALAAAFGAGVERALVQLRATDPASVLEPRQVGRAGLPSTVLGLLVHAAEHTTRHVGQLSVTARVAAAA